MPFFVSCLAEIFPIKAYIHFRFARLLRAAQQPIYFSG